MKEKIDRGDNKEKNTAIQFVNLAAQQNAIRPQLEENIQKVLQHGQYIMGPEVRQLEQNLESFTGAKHAISCSN